LKHPGFDLSSLWQFRSRECSHGRVIPTSLSAQKPQIPEQISGEQKS